MSKANIAKEILENNYCMINSILSKEESKRFKDKDFAAYLIRLCDKEIREISKMKGDDANDSTDK